MPPSLAGAAPGNEAAGYVACVQPDVTSLLHQRLLTPAVASSYVQRAGSFPAVPW
ncbi:MAG TPA: hypothetical protein VIA06_16815 [Candidatus Dormibacteraeota bacterium]|nr:hypothetical protein [Candidatus Dormibacteraeota bacterium]